MPPVRYYAKMDTNSIYDQIDPGRAQALCAVLGLDERPGPGDALPPFFHQIYFWQALAPGDLGRDGHPKLGGLVPDLGLPRRMWAGGRLRFHAPLRAGIEAVKASNVEAVTRKTGRTGALAFVTLRHVIRQAGKRVVTEMQDLVYGEDPSGLPSPKPPQAPKDTAGSEEVEFDTTSLFRYSALTLNGHRIHYDEAYAREVENYSGLVVHGPLLAQMLMLKATRELGLLSGFEFRATAPLIQGEAAVFCRDGATLWVRGPGGRLCMQATATV